MGNCQAIDAASLVIQHQSGRVERLYWPITANEVMKSNPNHYVALIITSCLAEGDHQKNVDNGGVRVTRVKLLKPTDLLVLGQAYRLINSEEVMKGLWAKKYAKMKKKEMESTEIKPQKAREVHTPECSREARTTQVEVNQEMMQEKNRHRRTSSAPPRGRQWRPSLQSISEAGLAQQSHKMGQPAHQSHRRNGQHHQRVVIPQSS